MSGNRPYVSRLPTDATGTPGQPIARGMPRPKLTPVRTFSLFGSRSRIALPSQPSVPTSSASAVCQMSIDRKWDRFGFGYPIPWMIATFPSSHSRLIGSRPGRKPTLSSSLSTDSGSIAISGRKS